MSMIDSRHKLHEMNHSKESRALDKKEYLEIISDNFC